MASLSNILKPFLFEISTLLGLILTGLLGLRVDALFGLQVFSTWPYSYFGIAPVLGGVGLRFWASFTIFNNGKGTPLYTLDIILPKELERGKLRESFRTSAGSGPRFCPTPRWQSGREWRVSNCRMSRTPSGNIALS